MTPENTAQTAQEQVKTEVQPVVAAPEREEDPNWKAIREARKKDKIEREAAEKRANEATAQAAALTAAMEAAFAKNPPQQYQQQQQNEYQEESEDERIEKKVAEALAKREATYAKERIKKEAEELPIRLRKAFPDYDKVVNEENGAYLEYHHPEILRSLLRQAETFESCADTYQLVKKLIPGLQDAKKEEAKTQANLLKPKSLSSASVTQSGETMSDTRLSEERKAANWARMKKELHGVV